MKSLISKKQLKSAKKILYMTHLAIGDFVYQGVFLRALKKEHPHLQVDIWIDDCREHQKNWHAGRNNTLCQWLQQESCIDEIYPIASSSRERQLLVRKAQAQDYDLIFFIANTRSEYFAKYARQISSSAYIVGTKSRSLANPLAKYIHFSQLDDYCKVGTRALNALPHISDVYGALFGKCVGVQIPSEKFSRVLSIDIPTDYQQQAKLDLEALRVRHKIDNPTYLMINHLSTIEKRDYKWSQVESLVTQLHDLNPNIIFVLNLPPAEYDNYKQTLALDPILNKLAIMAFTASNHFLALPAMIEQCHFVITVETAIMHLAASIGTPQIALVRESAKKWQPLTAEKLLLGKGRVDVIPVSDVVQSFKELSKN